MERGEEVDAPHPSQGGETPDRSLWDYGHLMMIQLSLKVAIELNIFNFIYNDGHESGLSSHEIAAKIPATNPNSIPILEKLLHFLTVNSLLSSSLRPCNGAKQNGTHERIYGLTGLSRCMLTNHGNGFSVAPLVMFGAESIVFERLNMLKDAILDSSGSSPFFTQRVDIYDVASVNPSLNKSLNDLMAFFSNQSIVQIFDVYKGFEGVTELLDVGGGDGTVLRHILTAYPQIRGINFDLPHVVADAPTHNGGLNHFGGNMFKSLPRVETIWMKQILHDWDDDKCKKLLKNCWTALPEKGKVIVMEKVVPENHEDEVTNDLSVMQVMYEFSTMLMYHTAKERTAKQMVELAKAGGFNATNFFPIKDRLHIIEFIKN